MLHSKGILSILSFLVSAQFLNNGNVGVHCAEVKDDPEDPSESSKKELTEYEYRNNLSSDLLYFMNTNLPGTRTVNVELGLSLASIIELDYNSEILVASLQMKLKWTDPRVQWNASEYGGVQRTAFPPHRMWIPRIFNKNSADSNFDPTFMTMAAITSDGQVQYEPPGIFRSSCPTDPTHFPFDYQTCHFQFGQMSDEGFQMDIVPPEMETGRILDEYTKHSQWDIVNITTERNFESGDLTFSFTFRRRPLYFIWTLVIPVLLMSYTLPLLLLIPLHTKERLICVFLFCAPLSELLRYFTAYRVSSVGISVVGRYALLINAIGFIILVESVLQAAFSRGQGVHGSQGSTKSNETGLIHGKDQQTAKAPVARRPGTMDVLLLLACYAILTTFNLYTFFTVPWFSDSRSHF